MNSSKFSIIKPTSIWCEWFLLTNPLFYLNTDKNLGQEGNSHERIPVVLPEKLEVVINHNNNWTTMSEAENEGFMLSYYLQIFTLSNRCFQYLQVCSD